MRVSLALIFATILLAPMAIQSAISPSNQLPLIQTAEAQTPAPEVSLRVDVLFTDMQRRTIGADRSPLDFIFDLFYGGKQVRGFVSTIFVSLPRSTDSVNSVVTSNTVVRVAGSDGIWHNIPISKNTSITKISDTKWQIEDVTLLSNQIEAGTGKTFTGKTQIEITNRGVVNAKIGCCLTKLGWGELKWVVTADRIVQKEPDQPPLTCEQKGITCPSPTSAIAVSVKLDRASYKLGDIVQITVATFDKLNQQPASTTVGLSVADPASVWRKSWRVDTSGGTAQTTYTIPKVITNQPQGDWVVRATVTDAGGQTISFQTALFTVGTPIVIDPTIKCSDGSTIPAGQECPPPQLPPIKCSDGSTIPAGQECPPPQPNYKTCEDGSQVLLTQKCPSSTQFQPSFPACEEGKICALDAPLQSGIVWTEVCVTFIGQGMQCSENVKAKSLPIADIFGTAPRKDSTTTGKISQVKFKVFAAFPDNFTPTSTAQLNWTVKVKDENGILLDIRNDQNTQIFQRAGASDWQLLEVILPVANIENTLANTKSTTPDFDLVFNVASGSIGVVTGANGNRATATIPALEHDYTVQTLTPAGTGDGDLPCPTTDPQCTTPKPVVGGKTPPTPPEPKPVPVCEEGKICALDAPPEIITPLIIAGIVLMVVVVIGIAVKAVKRRR